MDISHLKPKKIKEIRECLGMTQSQFANLMQVAPMTISKWERDLLYPGAFKEVSLNFCKRAVEKDATIGEKVKEVMIEKGLIWGMYHIMSSIGEYGPQ